MGASGVAVLRGAPILCRHAGAAALVSDRGTALAVVTGRCSRSSVSCTRSPGYFPPLVPTIMAAANRPARVDPQSVLAQNVFLVKEHLGLFKAANNFDLYDPGTAQVVLHCREENLGLFTKLLRFTDWKRMTPFDVLVRTPSGGLVLRISRGVSFIRSRVEVHDHAGRLLGTFKQRVFSIGGAFDLHDPSGRTVCTLQGKWTGWEFRFIAAGRELAKVSKKWAGLGKELFTSADNYVLSIDPSVPVTGPARPLILAAVLCIDMVLKE